jgi:hypothetical protein
MCARVMGTLSRAQSGRGDRGGVRRVKVNTQQLAWLVLEAVNRLQGRGSTVRLVVPSAPEVTHQLDPTLAEHELLAAEEYLLNRGHIAPANLGLTWATYTITPAGLAWLDEGLPWPSGAPQTPAADMEAAEHGSGEEEAQEGEVSSWWRRALGG